MGKGTGERSTGGVGEGVTHVERMSNGKGISTVERMSNVQALMTRE